MRAWCSARKSTCRIKRHLNFNVFGWVKFLSVGVIASSRVDLSECFGFTYQETSVVRYSAGNTGGGDKNHTEFMRGGHVHLQGSLECAREPADMFSIRTLVESWDDHFVQTDGNVSGTQVQMTAAGPVS